MSLFLFIVLSVYGAVHVYAFLKIKAAFPFGPVSGLLLGIFMVTMVFAPALVRILERLGHDCPARIISYIGYGWMGALFIFFCLSFVSDLWRLAAYTAGFILHRDPAPFVPAARTAFLAQVILTLAIAVYGYAEALNIRPEFITIQTPKIPESTGRLRVVQISDVHLGIMVRQERLHRILTVIREARPDILVSTGDLVDGQIDGMQDLADALSQVHPPLGKYAVTGNHEFYAGLDHALEITARSGFTILRNEAVRGPITIAGVDDPTGRRLGLTNGISEGRLLSTLPKDRFTLLLKHQPHIRTDSPGLFDLQLSGHTHKGQIFPFGYLVRIFFPHIAGWHGLPGGSALYVSRGTGTWGPPIRFLSPPEVTVIDLVHGGEK